MPESFNVLDEKVKSNYIVMGFKLFGLKVIVNLKLEDEYGARLLGRVAFFSRCSYQDYTSIQMFLHERRLNFVDINVDVYPHREKGLV
nr:uncharacterized protein LOC109185933 [Ipomoea trifida]